jgi:hypothetical protein
MALQAKERSFATGAELLLFMLTPARGGAFDYPAGDRAGSGNTNSVLYAMNYGSFMPDSSSPRVIG